MLNTIKALKNMKRYMNILQVKITVHLCLIALLQEHYAVRGLSFLNSGSRIQVDVSLPDLNS